MDRDDQGEENLENSLRSMREATHKLLVIDGIFRSKGTLINLIDYHSPSKPGLFNISGLDVGATGIPSYLDDEQGLDEDIKFSHEDQLVLEAWVEAVLATSTNGRSQKFELALKAVGFGECHDQENKVSLHMAVTHWQFLLGYDFPLSAALKGGNVPFDSPGYDRLSADADCHYLLLDCCRFLSIQYLRLAQPNLVVSAAWIYESKAALESVLLRMPDISKMHEWHFSSRINPKLSIRTVEMLLAQAEIFHALSNSSAYQHSLELASRYFHSLSSLYEKREFPTFLVETLIDVDNTLQAHYQNEQCLRLRHPDPSQDRRFNIVDSMLQVRGVWEKLATKPETAADVNIYNPGVFIWNGYLHIIKRHKDGKEQSRPGPDELRHTRLFQTNQWETVTIIPTPAAHYTTIRIHEDKLYLFSGHPIIKVFDLRSGRWSNLRTTYKNTRADRQAGLDPIWPWPQKLCGHPCVQFARDRMYVFGGMGGKNLTGSTLFMELNLKTLVWRRRGGLPWLTETRDPSLPGPRHGSASWASADGGKIYIYSGVCDQKRPFFENRHGPGNPWAYDDLWSWDIEDEKWRKESMIGNGPSPRTSMGQVYSRKLNRLIIFGGMNPMCISFLGNSDRSLRGTVYADTFIFTPPDVSKNGATMCDTQQVLVGRWQQVQTCGFPTYRTECFLVEDPDTGYIYLYGGKVRADTLPSKRYTEAQRRDSAKYENSLSETLSSFPELASALQMEDIAGRSTTQSPGDLWKLHIDIPGGDFESVNMEEELRTAPLGPWQRCFECRKVGFWKKCGGVCNGKVFFCGVDCQSKGWKDHKNMHGCRKAGKPGGGGAK